MAGGQDNAYQFERVEHHPQFGDAVVIKSCPSGDTAAIARLRSEFALTRSLTNLHGIHVPISAIKDDNNYYTLVFAADHPLPSGAQPTTLSLAEYLSKHKYVSVDQAAALLRHTATLLDQVHARGIVYSNVSPDSLWLHFASTPPPSSGSSSASSSTGPVSSAGSGDLLAQKWSDISLSLTDFGHARKITNDIVSITSVCLDDVCGDVRFMSPESTGRTSRPMDGRSDIYSLGMLLHSALTGEMPRYNMSVLQLVHYSMAVTPIPLTHATYNKKMSHAQSKAAAFQKILDGMTAKLPENRFRTCRDILDSLDAFAASEKRWQDFSPRLSSDRGDLANIIMMDTRLYGRKAHIEQLCAFQRQVYGARNGGIAVIKGPSGAGKTALVQELARSTCADGGVLCAGKSDRYKNDVPFLPLVHACSDMINLALVEEERTVKDIACSISHELGENQDLILEMLPNMQHLLKAGGIDCTAERRSSEGGHNHDCANIASTSQYPDRVMLRLQKSLTAVLAVFAAHRPLTLFLDDVQWTDPSSLKLIVDVISATTPQRLLLVLAHRVDSDPSSNTLQQLEEILDRRRGKILLHEQQLENLDLHATEEMLHDLLQPDSDDTTDLKELAALMHERTLGNPLSIRQSLKQLVTSGALQLTSSSSPTESRTCWTWDKTAARQQVVPSEDLVEALCMQIDSLPEFTRYLMQAGALLGHTFSPHTVSKLLMLPTDDIMCALEPVVAIGYLGRIGGAQVSGADFASATHHPGQHTYNRLRRRLGLRDLSSLDSVRLAADGVRYLFLNDTRDSAKAPSESAWQHDSATDLSDRRDTETDNAEHIQFQWMHDRLQQAALQLLHKAGEYEDACFTIGHWFLHRLLNGERERVFECSHLLVEAKTLEFARQATDLIDQHMWTTDGDIAFRAYHSLIAAQHDNNKFDEMKTTIDAVLKQSLSICDRAVLMHMQIMRCISQSQPAEAISIGAAALEQLGYPLPTDQNSLRALVRTLPTDLHTIRDLKYCHTSSKGNPQAQIAATITASLTQTAWFYIPRMFGPVTILGAAVTLHAGNSEISAMTFTAAAAALQVALDDIEVSFAYARLGMDIAADKHAVQYYCPVKLVYALQAQAWCEPLPNVVKVLEEGAQTGKALINYEFKYLTGENLHALLAQADQVDKSIIDNSDCSQQLYFRSVKSKLSHLGRKNFTPVSEYMSAEETAACSGGTDASFALFGMAIDQLLLHLLSDDVPTAMQSLQQSEKLLLPHFEWVFHASSFHLLSGLITARHLMLGDNRYDNKAWGPLHKALTKHREWATRCPSTFACRLNLLQGCQLWLQGNVCAAFDCLDKAVRLAQLEGFVHLEAVANETIGHLFLDVQHNVQMATPYMQAAQQAYRRWGAEWKARSLAEKYGGGGGGGGNGSGSAAPVAAQQSSTAADVVDIETMYDWTVALGSESTQDGVVCEFMSLAVMHSGSTEARLLWTAQEAGQEDGAAGEMQCLAMSSIDALSGQIETRVRPEQQDWLTSMAPLVNYVLRTKETLTETSPAMVSLLRQCARRPHTGSILLLPILLRDQCVGILYLSNELTSGNSGGGGGGAGDDQVEGKDSKRIVIMRLLSAQLAVTLDNMRLLDQLRGSNKALQAQTVTLEERVDERTAELADANARLQHLIVACREAERLARAAAEANRNFLHHMSHELRTPLNAIVGMVDLLLDEDGLTDEQRDKVESTALASRALMQIVNNVLDLGKIQAGKMTLNLKPFCLRNEVECAMESVAQTAAGKELTLATHFAGTVPQSLTGDGIRVGQVLRNLLSNAVKFTEQGHVLLHVTATEIAGETGHCLFTIRCTDTGPGIAEEEAHRLFKEFSQLDSSSTRVHGGTGLGLNISKGFALLMKGDVTCESEVGRGSTFIFTFQCAAAPCGQPPLQLPPDTRIVVCHPLLVVQQMVQSYLTFNAAPSSGHIICADPAELPAMLQSLQAQAKHIFILPQIPDTVSRIVLGNDRHEPAPLLSNARMPLRQVQLMRAIAQFPTLRVLVAEDNELSQKLALQLLKRFGIQADLAANGVEAVTACERNDYDLLLMDIQMPKMDGVCATKMIREMLEASSRPHPRILAQSAHAFVEDKATYIGAGMDDTLVKPLKLDILQELFCTHFASRRAS
ncbi:hypothetical protein RI367_004542 [Sorochytrium milnesiophthora]